MALLSNSPSPVGNSSVGTCDENEWKECVKRMWVQWNHLIQNFHRDKCWTGPFERFSPSMSYSACHGDMTSLWKRFMNWNDWTEMTELKLTFPRGNLARYLSVRFVFPMATSATSTLVPEICAAISALYVLKLGRPFNTCHGGHHTIVTLYGTYLYCVLTGLGILMIGDVGRESRQETRRWEKKKWSRWWDEHEDRERRKWESRKEQMTAIEVTLSLSLPHSLLQCSMMMPFYGGGRESCEREREREKWAARREEEREVMRTCEWEESLPSLLQFLGPERRKERFVANTRRGRGFTFLHHHKTSESSFITLLLLFPKVPWPHSWLFRSFSTTTQPW